MTLPQSMTYIAASGAGGPDVLTPATGRLPEPKPDEVLIRVMAAGVNRPDVPQRQGAYPPPPGASPILGLEVAGEVVAPGSDAAGLAARRPRVRADQRRRLRGILRRAGARNACPGRTATTRCAPRRCRRRISPSGPTCSGGGRLARGETALIHGGTGGIGVTAIQLAREFGAERVRHRRVGREMRRLPPPRRRRGDQLPHPGFRSPKSSA